MNPMILREPTSCCQTKLLVWVPKKGYFICPCGEMNVDVDGRLKKTRGKFNKGDLRRPHL